MADALYTIRQGLTFARQVSAMIPGASAASPFIGIAEGLAAVLDGLVNAAPDENTKEQIRATRAQLAAAVSAKAERTADRFD